MRLQMFKLSIESNLVPLNLNIPDPINEVDMISQSCPVAVPLTVTDEPCTTKYSCPKTRVVEQKRNNLITNFINLKTVLKISDKE